MIRELREEIGCDYFFTLLTIQFFKQYFMLNFKT